MKVLNYTSSLIIDIYFINFLNTWSSNFNSPEYPLYELFLTDHVFVA